MNAKRMRILVGYDGSDCANAAIDDLLRAGLPAEAETRVLSVSERWMPPPSSWELVREIEGGGASDQPRNAVTDALELATQGAEIIKSRFPGWEVIPDGRSGSPAGELIRLADYWHPDLLVVGSKGRTAIGRLFLGSVSQRVVTEAHCSVRVARGRIDVESLPIRLLIAYDCSDFSQAAVEAVTSRTWPDGTEAQLLTVIDPLTEANASLIEQTLYEVSGKQERIVASLVDAGLLVSKSVEFGDPKRLIIEQAERWGADAIFVGTRGLGSIGRLLLGSVATAIVGRAPCSVEVVRAAKRD